MKKIVKLLALVAMLCLLLVGCGMKMEIGLRVNPDKTVEMTVLSAMDDELIEAYLSMEESGDGEGSGEREYTDEEKWAFLESSNTVTMSGEEVEKERYDDGTYKGYRTIRKADDIDTLSVEGDTVEVDWESISESDKIFAKNGDTYMMHLTLNESGEIADAKAYSEQGIDMQVDFTITLPNPAETHNATSVSEDGLTYTWNMLTSESVDISFKLTNVQEKEPVTTTDNPTSAGQPLVPPQPAEDQPEQNNTMLPIIIGCCIGVVAVVAIVLIIKKKSK